MSSSVVILTAAAIGPLTLALPALITYRRRAYSLVITARNKLELRAYDPADMHKGLDSVSEGLL